jgi:TolA-binding protein
MRPTLIATTALLVVMSGAAGAQSNIEGRVGKLESEMRAVQRKVFPQGAGRYFQPEVEAEPAGPAQTGVPATSALADLTARVSALETQLTSLTGQVEQAGFRTRQVQEQFEAYRRATDARLKTLEGAGTAPAAAAAGADEDAPTPPVRPVARPASTPARAPATPARADADETPAATTAVTRPNTGDAAEDAYLFGYRLWAAKRYPEAQAALKKAAADHPKSRRYSYAQNLLGRAYLDDGKPSLASMAFYDNYKKMPDGERAPESLFYLATALQRLNKPADACKVYDELTDVYAAKIGAKMKADIAAGRAAAKCKAA